MPADQPRESSGQGECPGCRRPMAQPMPAIEECPRCYPDPDGEPARESDDIDLMGNLLKSIKKIARWDHFTDEEVKAISDSLSLSGRGPEALHNETVRECDRRGLSRVIAPDHNNTKGAT